MEQVKIRNYYVTGVTPRTPETPTQRVIQSHQNEGFARRAANKLKFDEGYTYTFVEVGIPMFWNSEVGAHVLPSELDAIINLPEHAVEGGITVKNYFVTGLTPRAAGGGRAKVQVESFRTYEEANAAANRLKFDEGYTYTFVEAGVPMQWDKAKKKYAVPAELAELIEEPVDNWNPVKATKARAKVGA